MTDPGVNKQESQTVEDLRVGQLKFDQWVKRLFPKDVLKRTLVKEQLQTFLRK